MAIKTVSPEKKQRRIEATKLRSWTFKNLTILVSSDILPLGDLPNWLSCIRQARMLEDIEAIWVATEVIIKRKCPEVKTACDEASYATGLKELVKMSLSGRPAGQP